MQMVYSLRRFLVALYSLQQRISYNEDITMKTLSRLTLIALAAFVAACSTTTEREYETCIVGITVLGAAAGATSSGAGVIAGTAVGAVGGAVICRPPPQESITAMAAPMDSDGDGVNDDGDDCPNTPPGTAVDSRGCSLDSDSDGVNDDRDACPNTPVGVQVDNVGCPVPDEVLLTVERLNFTFDSAELDAASRSALDDAVDVIKSHSKVKLDVIGYTDTSGPESYNQGLSERRAQAALDYLVSRGVDADQLNATGRGEADPVASNDTRDGRSRNRRVELVVR
jgi:OOP family OmpA-OmpF porin